MANLSIEYDKKDFMFMDKLRKMFPEIRAQAMGYVGSEGKKRLKNRFLSGQEIDLKQYPKDIKGRRTISYSIGRNANYVKISSYPLNLFERGRTLRSGKREKGKRVITGKFKRLMMSDLRSIVNQFDTKILDKKLDKI